MNSQGPFNPFWIGNTPSRSYGRQSRMQSEECNSSGGGGGSGVYDSYGIGYTDGSSYDMRQNGGYEQSPYGGGGSSSYGRMSGGGLSSGISRANVSTYNPYATSASGGYATMSPMASTAYGYADGSGVPMGSFGGQVYEQTFGAGMPGAMDGGMPGGGFMQGGGMQGGGGMQNAAGPGYSCNGLQ